MNRRTGVLVGLVVVLVVGGILAVYFSTGPGDPEDPTQEAPEEELILFYPSRDGRELVPVSRTPESMPETREDVPETVVDMLKQVPEDEELVAVVPEEMSLRSSFFEDSIVWLDFNDGIIGAAEGSAGEYVLLYSVVNSVLANLDPSFQMVFFLVEGEHRNTIGPYGEDSGHIAINVPLGPRWDERP